MTSRISEGVNLSDIKRLRISRVSSSDGFNIGYNVGIGQ
jgi:hypothetical protein